MNRRRDGSCAHGSNCEAVEDENKDDLEKKRNEVEFLDHTDNCSFPSKPVRKFIENNVILTRHLGQKLEVFVIKDHEICEDIRIADDDKPTFTVRYLAGNGEILVKCDWFPSVGRRSRKGQRSA